MAVNPLLCGRMRELPIMPPGADIVTPVTTEERAATGLFLGWLRDVFDVAHEAVDRAKAAQVCR